MGILFYVVVRYLLFHFHLSLPLQNLLLLVKARKMPLTIQKEAPDFTATAVMPGGEFKEICSFSDRVEEFKALNCEVIGVSIDSKYSHLAWTKLERKKGGIGPCGYPLVADITKAISKDYEVLIEEGEDAGISLRGLFIISDKGILRQKTVNDLPVGRNVDEVLRLIQAFQYTDTHGEVCPIGWKPGAKTMVDDPTKSLDYFGTLEN